MMLHGGIYIASKAIHGPRWRFIRDGLGYPIISTWIDEAGPGQTKSFDDLWFRCIQESSTAGALIVYREAGEVLKGGWVEVGAALAWDVPVFGVGISEFSIAKFSGIRHCSSVMDALTEITNLSLDMNVDE